MSDKINNLEIEIEKIKKRNKRVELEKAWETSFTRSFSIIITTYVLVVVVMYIFKINEPFINAIIPTLGYFLSIQSIPFIKRWWIKKRE